VTVVKESISNTKTVVKEVEEISAAPPEKIRDLVVPPEALTDIMVYIMHQETTMGYGYTNHAFTGLIQSTY
jgi:hypothetical protein